MRPGRQDGAWKPFTSAGFSGRFVMILVTGGSGGRGTLVLAGLAGLRAGPARGRTPFGRRRGRGGGDRRIRGALRRRPHRGGGKGGPRRRRGAGGGGVGPRPGRRPPEPARRPRL